MKTYLLMKFYSFIYYFDESQQKLYLHKDLGMMKKLKYFSLIMKKRVVRNE
jgi:hypothetical protein